MTQITPLYLVTYWFYDDTDTIHTEAFLTQEEATKFEEDVYAKCKELRLQVDVNVEIGRINTREAANVYLQEILRPEVIPLSK